MRGIMGQGLRESRGGFGLGYLASFWLLCQRLDLVVVGEAATMLAMGKLLHTHRHFQKKGGGAFFFKVSLFPCSHPINFLCALFLQSLWLSSKPAASQASLQVLLFQRLNHNPLQPFSPHFILPSLFLPISFSLSVYDGHVSWGKTVGRMQACCHGNRNPPSP